MKNKELFRITETRLGIRDNFGNTSKVGQKGEIMV